MAPRLLVPIDFSDDSRVLLDRAARLAGEMNAAVDLLHVWPRQAAPARAEEPVARLALARVALAMDDLRRSVLGGQEAESRIRIAYGAAAEGIVRVAGEGYDLIVMGHCSGRDRPCSGVVDRVAAAAPCPVIAVELGGGGA